MKFLKEAWIRVLESESVRSGTEKLVQKAPNPPPSKRVCLEREPAAIAKNLQSAMKCSRCSSPASQTEAREGSREAADLKVQVRQCIILYLIQGQRICLVPRRLLKRRSSDS